MVRSDYAVRRALSGEAQTSWCWAAYIAAWVRLDAPVLSKMLRMWFAAVLPLM
jgi:hypothetical protein